jgi:hypothetical protein
VRDNFFAARTFVDLDDLNVQAETWCRGLAADRRCPGQDTLSVREAFATESPRLLALPDNPYPLIERVAVKAGKTPYVRFDLNDYSIPHTKVQRLLTVLGSASAKMSRRRNASGLCTNGRAFRSSIDVVKYGSCRNRDGSLVQPGTSRDAGADAKTDHVPSLKIWSTVKAQPS